MSRRRSPRSASAPPKRSRRPSARARTSVHGSKPNAAGAKKPSHTRSGKPASGAAPFVANPGRRRSATRRRHRRSSPSSCQTTFPSFARSTITWSHHFSVTCHWPDGREPRPGTPSVRPRRLKNASATSSGSGWRDWRCRLTSLASPTRAAAASGGCASLAARAPLSGADIRPLSCRGGRSKKRERSSADSRRLHAAFSSIRSTGWHRAFCDAFTVIRPGSADSTRVFTVRPPGIALAIGEAGWPGARGTA